MAEAKSKRDLIWEQKRRQREERLLQQQQGGSNFNNLEEQPISQPTGKDHLFDPDPNQGQNHFQYDNYVIIVEEPPQQQSSSRQQAQVEPQPQRQQQQQYPQQMHQQQQQEAYQPQQYQESQNIYEENLQQSVKNQLPPKQDNQPTKMKQIKNEYGDYLKQQIQEKEMQKQMNRQQISSSVDQRRGNYNQPNAKQSKNDYGEFLRQQMQEKEMQKKQQRIQSGGMRQQQDFQQPQQYIVQSQPQQESMNPEDQMKKQQKQQYAEYLKEQMLLKERQKQEDKKNKLQNQMQNQNSFPFGRGGGGAPMRDPQGNIQTRRQQGGNPQYPQQTAQPIQQQPQYQYAPQQQQYYPPQPQPEQYQDNYQNYDNQYQQDYQQKQYQQQQDYQPRFQQQQQQNFNQYEQPMQDPYQNQFPPQPPQMAQAPQPAPSYSPQQANLLDQQEPPNLRVKQGRNRLMMENANMDEMAKKEKQKQEMQMVLQQQIQEKERKKKEEEARKKQEDLMEEQRIQREREQLELEIKREEEKKKQKMEGRGVSAMISDLQRDNANLKEQKKEDLRLQRLQERRNRQKGQQDDEGGNGNILKEYLKNEKLKEGADENQSLVDFYKNGPKSQQQISPQDLYGNDYQPQQQQQGDMFSQPDMFQQQNAMAQQYMMQPSMQPPMMQPSMQPAMMQPNPYLNQIEELKKQMQDQQQSLQFQIQEMMNQAQLAISNRNQAEQEFHNLKTQVQQKYAQDEQNQNDLMLALVRNDPKYEKQVFPPHLMAQAMINEERDLGMPQNIHPKLPPQDYTQPKSVMPIKETKPLVFKQQTHEEKKTFNEQFGLQSLASDSNFVPIEFGANQQTLAMKDYSMQQNRKPPTPKYRDPYQGAHNLPQIDELHNQYEDSMHLNDTYNLEKIQYQRPPSHRSDKQTWNVPSINSEITREIDALMNYKPITTIHEDAPQKKNRPPSSKQSSQRPPSSTFNLAAKGILQNSTQNVPYEGQETYVGNNKGFTLNSDFPDLTYKNQGATQERGYKPDQTQQSYNTNTFDIGQINKKMDERLQKLNDLGMGTMNQTNKQDFDFNQGTQQDEDLDKLDKLLMNYKD